MPRNTGNGARAVAVNMGSGSPNGSMNGRDNAARAGAGSQARRSWRHWPDELEELLECAGPGRSSRRRCSRAGCKPAGAATTLASAPKVTYKPTPVYTEEAKAMHLEGNVSLRIRVTASGAVQVLGVVHGLGHGLDQSAIQATEATRFKPALDNAGRAIDWEGVVLVNFQMS